MSGVGTGAHRGEVWSPEWIASRTDAELAEAKLIAVENANFTTVNGYKWQQIIAAINTVITRRAWGSL